MKRQGVTQKQLVERLAERGVQLSQPTMTRVMKGERQLSEGELRVICELLDEESQYERLRVLLPKRATVKQTQLKQRARLRGFLRRRPVTSAVLAFLVGGASVAAVFIFQGTSSAGSTPSPGGADQSGGGQVPACDQYEVAVRDLWLRDEYGAPQIELPHGEKVTVTRRASPYWEVTADSGHRGWVDDNHLKPLC